MVETEFLRKSGIIRCESFGCIALGLAYFALGGLIPVIFAVVAAFKAKENKLKNALISAAISGLAMLVAFFVIYQLQQAEIRRGYADKEAACKEYPQLCPEMNQVKPE